MLAMMLVAPNKLEQVTLDEPTVPAHHALLEVLETGVCGSDIKIYSGGHPKLRPPIVLGHEIVARVVTSGGDDGYAEGDIVTVMPTVSCGHCSACQRGDINLCYNTQIVGGQLIGGMAEHIAVPINNVIPINPAVPAHLRVLIEPTSIAVHTADRAEARGDDRILVIGAGPIGLLTSLNLIQRGTADVTIADDNDMRVAQAEKLGLATYHGRITEVTPQMNRDIGAHDGFDVVIDCVGAESVVQASLALTRKGGRIVLAGIEPSSLTIDGSALQREERSLIGVMMCMKEDFFRAQDLLADDRWAASVGQGEFFSVFGMESAPEALRQVRDGRAGLKTVLQHRRA